MAEAEAKVQITKTPKVFLGAQISLRILAVAATLVATWLILTSKQSASIFGITFDARYSYSPAFKYCVFANAIACITTLISLFLVFIFCGRSAKPSNYFYLFLHDLCIMSLLLAGCAAATAIGYVGQHGNSHTGWLPICDHFGKFCKRIQSALMLSYLSVIILLVLTVISAGKYRKI